MMKLVVLIISLLFVANLASTKSVEDPIKIEDYVLQWPDDTLSEDEPKLSQNEDDYIDYDWPILVEDNPSDYNFPNNIPTSDSYNLMKDQSSFISFDGSFGGINDEQVPWNGPQDSLFPWFENSQDSFDGEDLIDEENPPQTINIIVVKSENLYLLDPSSLKQDSQQQRQILSEIHTPALTLSAYEKTTPLRLAGPLIMLSVMVTVASAILLLYYLAKKRPTKVNISQVSGQYRRLTPDVV